MNKTLIVLVLAVIVLAWNFVFTDKKVGLTDQARVLQGLSNAIAYKTAIADYWAARHSLPDNKAWLNENKNIRVDLSQTIVKAIDVGLDGPGVISVHYVSRPGLESAAGIDGKKINLVPNVENNMLVWTCKGTVAANLLPKNCSPL